MYRTNEVVGATTLRQLCGNERGNVAIIFALVLIPIAGITASAVDYGWASKVRTQLLNAADVAIDHASQATVARRGPSKERPLSSGCEAL